MKLQELGENRLLAKLISPLPTNRDVVVGPGDDCAVLRGGADGRLLLLKTDCIIEGVHFESDAAPRDVGWKAMARPLSDFAAMSGVPQFALVTLIAKPETTLRWTTSLYSGLRKAAGKFGVLIVGGETSSTSGPATISVSMVGSAEPDRWVARSGGNPGDELFVTGRLGGSLRGSHLTFMPRIEESRWLTAHFDLHAMMDLSDGLGADLPRLAHASGVAFELDEAALPRNRGCNIEQALADGEDYELLFAVDPADSVKLQRNWRRKFPRLPLTRIGSLKPLSSKLKRHGLPRGYVHFK